MQLKYIYFFILLTLPLIVQAAPVADLWPYWAHSDESNRATISHHQWHKLLQKYVAINQADGINKFAYSRVTEADREILAQYLSKLQNIKITNYSKKQQLAYWINLYNTLTVAVVIEHYPVDSILDITYKPRIMFWKFGPWDEQLLTIENKKLTLNDIEHRILRPIWKDNRVHYALNCASMGCPNLLNTAYTANNVEAFLNNNAITFINSQRAIKFKQDKLVVSSIYKWFKQDFADNNQELLTYLAKYAKPELRAQLNNYRGRIDNYYDWRLNAAS